MMKYKEYVHLVKSDLHRYAGNSKFSSFIRNILFEPRFKFSYWLRTCAFTRSHPFLRIFFPVSWLMLRHYQIKYGIAVSYKTRVDSGFFIGHIGGIVVNRDTVIGRNCNISHQVTLGVSRRGERQGCPVIGDNVYIGPGAKIIGRVVVGDNAAIGANCVVTMDVPENGVVVGIPGRVISYEGSAGYINRTDY